MLQKTILFPTDFSPCADNAFQYAKALAKSTRSQLKIVHSLDLMGVYATDADASTVMVMIEALEASATSKLKELSHLLTSENILHQTNLLNGTEINWLAQLLKENQADLVIMGTTGAHSLENKLFGSMTHKLISDAEYPVLAIPEKAVFNEFKKIIYATDYHISDIQNLKTLVHWMRPFKSKIEFVHIATGQLEEAKEKEFFNDFKEDIEALVDYPHMSAHLLYADNVEHRLHHLIEDEKCDLLVLVTQKRNFFERIFTYSLSKNMAYHSDRPLLVFKNNQY